MKLNKRFSTLLSLTILFASTTAIAEPSWQIKKDKDGIQVFTREIKDSKLDEFKGITTINTSVASVVAVLKDVATFSNWMPDTKTSKILEQDETKQAHYIVSDMPWPVTDRDGVYQFTFEALNNGTAVNINVEAKPEYLPNEKGIIRIPEAKGFWKIKSIDKGVEVQYQMHANPGGALPAWMVNSAVVDSPFNTLKNLRTQVQKEKYQNKSYAFLNGN